MCEDIALPVFGTFVPKTKWLDPETNLLWFHLEYDGTYEMFRKMPKVAKMNGVYFVKTSHNSDTFNVCYKETAKENIAEFI